MGVFAGVLLTITGCGDALPCSSGCPDIEGTYALEYQAANPSCGEKTAPPTTITLTRQVSALSGLLYGIPCTGTVYDTYDFTLRGAAGAGEIDSVSLRGKWVGSRPDSGASATLRGTLSVTVGTGDTACTSSRAFTGGRL